MRVRRNTLAATAVLVLASALIAITPTQSQSVADGRLVAYNGDTGQLVTFNPDGSGITPVSPAGDDSFHPRWSRDGSKIVFAGNHAKAGIRIFTVNADGSGFHQVTHVSRGYNDFTPTFNADGTRVLFSRCRPDGPHDGCSLLSTNLDGNDVRTVAPRVVGDDFWPDVSPDGSQVAFGRFDYQGIQAQVWVVNADGTGAHAITQPSLEGSTPRWMPDGQHLVVSTKYAHIGINVFRIDADGGHPTRLTNRSYPHNAFNPAVSPSGSSIAYLDDQSFPDIIGGDVFVMNATGGGKHLVVKGGRYVNVDWSIAPVPPAGAARSAFRLATSGTSFSRATVPPELRSSR